MSRAHKPRTGSLQFWPRKRARRIYPRVRSWAEQKNISLQGFAGYKAGMTHIQFQDSRATSPTKGSIVAFPVTVIECPPLKALSINFYTSSPYGLSLSSSLFTKNFNKELKRKISLPKQYNYEEKLKKIKENLNNYSDIRLVVYTQPELVGIPKKKPEIFEINISGDNINEKLNYALQLLEKEIKVEDIIKAGQKLDIHAVTKGKGFQGSIKRFDMALKAHKSEKKRRAIGNLGPLGLCKVLPGVSLPGQMGLHTRTDYNKEIILVGNKPEKINPKGGFVRYGLVKNDYILFKGSVCGPKKRLIRFTHSIRNAKPAMPIEIKYISKESKQ